jgi:hypothetical protein
MTAMAREQRELILADLGGPQLGGRAPKMPGKADNDRELGALRQRRELAQLPILTHALT